MLPIIRKFKVYALSIILLGAGIQLSNSVQAQDVPKVTASAVVGEDGTVNEDSLKAFVTWATAVSAAITNFEEGNLLREAIYDNTSDYWSGNIYLVYFAVGDPNGDDGNIIFHPEYRNVEGKIALEVEDDRGTEVVKQMLEAGNEEAMKVEYCWNDPDDDSDNAPGDAICKPSYAMRYFAPSIGSDLVVVGGYHQDLSTLEIELPDIPLPEISASDVVDRESLKQFVDGAAEWSLQLFEEIGFTAIGLWKSEFRKDIKDGGFFKDGQILLYSMTPDGYVIFHALDPWREGRVVLGNPDLRGNTTFVGEIIEAGLDGGGFVDYYWDNLSDPNDDEEGSLRTTYATSIALEGIEGTFILAGSYFPDVTTSVEGGITELPTVFHLHGNYPNPFNPSTRIQFDLPERAQVTVQVMDVLGRNVVELPAQAFDAGANHTIELNAIHLSSGTYLYRMIAVGLETRYQKTGLMTLMK